MKIRTRSGLGLAVLLTAAAFARDPVTDHGSKVVRVELDVFSGRPNPHWDLTPGQSEEFLKLFRALPKDKSGKSVREGLGYRGIIVTAEDGKEAESFDDIVVSDGIVQGRRVDGSQTFSDKDRALERWLFLTAKGHIEPDLYQEIGRELNLP